MYSETKTFPDDRDAISILRSSSLFFDAYEFPFFECRHQDRERLSFKLVSLSEVIEKKMNARKRGTF